MPTRSDRRQPSTADAGNQEAGRPLRTRRPARSVDSARPEAPDGPVLTGIDDVRAPLGKPPGGAFSIRRRDLLAWGGAAALLPLFEGLARAQKAPAAAEAVRPMSIGFVEGSDTWRAFKGVTAGTLNRGVRREADRPPEAARVVPAASLIAGDQSLANELVWVRIHGLYPIPNPTHIANAYVTVFFPSPEPAMRLAPLPFTAWGYHSRPAPDPAPPIRFMAPLAADGGLDFLLEATAAPKSPLSRPYSTVSPAPSPAGGNFTASFTVDWFAGRPKLQRGLYLLGLAPDTWSTERTLPMFRPGQARPVELISLMVSFEPVVPR